MWLVPANMTEGGWPGTWPLCPPLTHPLFLLSHLCGQATPSNCSLPTPYSLSGGTSRTFSPFWGARFGRLHRAGTASKRPGPSLGKCSRGALGSPLLRALGGSRHSDKANMWWLSSHTICSKACKRTSISERGKTSLKRLIHPVPCPSPLNAHQGRLHSTAKERILRFCKILRHPSPTTFKDCWETSRKDNFCGSYSKDGRPHLVTPPAPAQWTPAPRPFPKPGRGAGQGLGPASKARS